MLLSEDQAVNRSTKSVDPEGNKLKLLRKRKLMSLYGSDIQAEIDRRLKANPNDIMISELLALRDEKLQSSYGNDYQAEIEERSPDDPIQSDLTRLRNQKILNSPALRDRYLNDAYPRLNEISTSLSESRDEKIQSFRQALQNALLEINRTKKLVQNDYVDQSQAIDRQSAEAATKDEEQIAAIGLSKSGFRDRKIEERNQKLKDRLGLLFNEKKKRLTTLDNQEKQLKAETENAISKENRQTQIDIQKAEQKEISRQDQERSQTLKDRFNLLMRSASNTRLEIAAELKRRKDEQALESESLKQQYTQSKITQLNDPNSAINRKKEEEIIRLKKLNEQVKVENKSINKPISPKSEVRKTNQNISKPSSTIPKTEKAKPVIKEEIDETPDNSPSAYYAERYEDFLSYYQKLLDDQPSSKLEIVNAIYSNYNIKSDIKEQLIRNLGLGDAEVYYYSH